MNRTIAFVLLTFILTGLGVYLFMGQVVMPRVVASRTAEAVAQAVTSTPVLTGAEARGLARVQMYNAREGSLLKLMVSRPLHARYARGKWVVSDSDGLFTFVVDDKTGKVTGP